MSEKLDLDALELACKTWESNMGFAPFANAPQVLGLIARIRELEGINDELLRCAQHAGEAVAWMTHHDEPMIFPTRGEAELHCDDDEEPIALYAAPQPAALPEGFVLVKAETVEWLLGERGEFECQPEQYFRGQPAPYFWRKALREAIAAAPQPRE
ncbi:hypothetical protein CBM2586_B10240 [Cupriavidus phytorum]|uniref:Uncharacterized protein n=1 Tax=Cupriavidus taiwanensis TaxID=164546 RepID=A0A976A784_9BURK|nr:hypothetical protein [Cupriavidus taiwanensis]SOY65645.1 hypothetical protein CBM2586_B10240 [Cupriavidus taiwanensis]